MSININEYVLPVNSINDFELQGKNLIINSEGTLVSLPCDNLHAIWMSYIKDDPTLIFPTSIRYTYFNELYHIYFEKDIHKFHNYYETQFEDCKEAAWHPYTFMYGNNKIIIDLMSIVESINTNNRALYIFKKYIMSFAI